MAITPFVYDPVDHVIELGLNLDFEICLDLVMTQFAFIFVEIIIDGTRRDFKKDASEVYSFLNFRDGKWVVQNILAFYR